MRENLQRRYVISWVGDYTTTAAPAVTKIDGRLVITGNSGQALPAVGLTAELKSFAPGLLVNCGRLQSVSPVV